ncbi:hypothetical protein MKEN_01004100 [Mycena kentingensis (nom. inval.)]|nr:hypothetical protein MKEN_01004100 [Mycena kentingensis (nom. inval.)]
MVENICGLYVGAASHGGSCYSRIGHWPTRSGAQVNSQRTARVNLVFEWPLAYLSVLVALASPSTSFRQAFFFQLRARTAASTNLQRCRGGCTLDADNLGRERDGSGAGTRTRARRWREDLVGRNEACGLGATRGVDFGATRERTWDAVDLGDAVGSGGGLGRDARAAATRVLA